MPPFRFQPGDIAACFGTDRASRIISLGTWSPVAPAGLRSGPSHVALLCEVPDDAHVSAGRLVTENCLWIESTTMCPHPCLLRKDKVSGVQAHRPTARIADYTKSGGRVDIYRLSPIDRLNRQESRLLTTILINHFVKRNIDYDMGGALLSGTRVLKLSRLLSSDLNEVFCSELVSAIVQRLGRLNRRNPTRHNPASLLRQLVRQGTYQKVCSFPSPSRHASAHSDPTSDGAGDAPPSDRGRLQSEHAAIPPPGCQWLCQRIIS